MAQIKDTLADIDILDTACHTASSRLSSLRLSKVMPFPNSFFYYYNYKIIIIWTQTIVAFEPRVHSAVKQLSYDSRQR
jgi:hypothetical protein